jgi:hypothetical protein
MQMKKYVDVCGGDEIFASFPAFQNRPRVELVLICTDQVFWHLVSVTNKSTPTALRDVTATVSPFSVNLAAVRYTPSIPWSCLDNSSGGFPAALFIRFDALLPLPASYTANPEIVALPTL